MANTGPIQVPSNLSQLSTLPDLVRFVSSFATQAASQFNGLFATKTAWGAIGISGVIAAGSGNYGASLVSTGTYYIKFREDFSQRPVAAVTSEQVLAVPQITGATLSGFQVLMTAAGATVGVNAPFSFIAMGAR